VWLIEKGETAEEGTTGAEVRTSWNHATNEGGGGGGLVIRGRKKEADCSIYF